MAVITCSKLLHGVVGGVLQRQDAPSMGQQGSGVPLFKRQ
jgi:hypothetical protein